MARGRLPDAVTATRTPMRILVLILLVAALSGCSARRREQAPPVAVVTPATLKERIADADRIIVTNRFADDNKRYRGFSMTVSGAEVKRVIKAILAAERLDVGTLSIWDWDFKFYREHNYLGSIYSQGSVFLLGQDRPNMVLTSLGDGAVGHDEYVDGSGVLKSIYDDLLRRTGQ